MGASPSLVASKTIIESMKEGKIILIQARLPASAKRFSVDLLFADNTVAFHFNPRVDEAPKVIICNTYSTYMWGKEERTFDMPFSQGKFFEMTITVKSDCYEVAVNGEILLTYDHRVPYHKVRKLEFRGDITVEGVSYHSEKNPPPYSPPVQGDIAAAQVENKPVKPVKKNKPVKYNQK